MTQQHPEARAVRLERTQQWTVTSRSGRAYQLLLALPKGVAAVNGYPVIFVLDPHTAFATLVDTVRNHETMYGPVVVVGVGYPPEVNGLSERLFDLTPPTDPATLPNYRPAGWGPLGGADAFLNFLRDELRPLLDKRVPLDHTRQALFGHSLGGLFALHVLFTRLDTFQTYVAASPAIWWGNKAVLNQLQEFKRQQRSTETFRRLLITVGELEATVSAEELRAAALDSIDLPAVRQHSKMVENAAALATELEPLSAHGLMTTFAKFPQETHTSVIPAYLSRGARFTLSGWFD